VSESAVTEARAPPSGPRLGRVLSARRSRSLLPLTAGAHRSPRPTRRYPSPYTSGTGQGHARSPAAATGQHAALTRPRDGDVCIKLFTPVSRSPPLFSTASPIKTRRGEASQLRLIPPPFPLALPLDEPPWARSSSGGFLLALASSSFRFFCRYCSV
jgi:hypothetical protein